MDDPSQMNRISFSKGKALAKRLTAFILCLILLSAQAAFPAAAAEPGRTGDESPVMVWISLAVISAAGLTALLRLRRRTK